MTRWVGRLPAWSGRALQGVVALGLLALLWRAADGPSAARTLAGAEPFWLAAALAALTLQTLLSALRWRLTARQLGIVIGTGHAVREYYLAQAVNLSLPGGALGDAGRAVRARGQAGLLASGQAVVIERLAGQIAMVTALGVGFLATLAVPGGLGWPGWLAGSVAAGLALGCMLPLAFAALTHLPGPLGRGTAAFGRALRRTLIDRRAWPGQVALSLGTTICNLAAFAFCARAVGVPLPLSAVLALVPLILFTMLVPVTVSGWGLREGAAAGLFPLAGASASAGLATSVAFGLMLIVSVLPGLGLLWLKRQADPPRRDPANGDFPPNARDGVPGACPAPVDR